jgi:hypothetical protein
MKRIQILLSKNSVWWGTETCSFSWAKHAPRGIKHALILRKKQASSSAYVSLVRLLGRGSLSERF